jgi:uncharacterized protein
MPKPSADEVIDALDLQPLPGEGGYFRQTWIAEGEREDAPIGTSILYLVTPASFSARHRLAHDEVFHFYLGDPCEMVIVAPDGELESVILGHDIMAGMAVQHVVPARSWQGTKLVPGGNWALLGTTMAPGFHVSGFELATEGIVDTFAPGVARKVRAFLAPRP